MVSRYQLNVKKTKIDKFPAKKAVGLPTQHLALFLNNAYNADDFIDEMKPLSRSLVGGNINICKARTIEFMHTDSNQGLLCCMLIVDMDVTLYNRQFYLLLPDLILLFYSC